MHRGIRENPLRTFNRGNVAMNPEPIRESDARSSSSKAGSTFFLEVSTNDFVKSIVVIEFVIPNEILHFVKK